MADVRDFIINDETGITHVESPRRRAYNKPVIEYEVVLQDGPDGVLRRKTKTTSRLLVILMTKKQFYIKDERTDEVTMLDAKSLADFLKGVEDGINLVPWCTGMTSGLKRARKFVKYVNAEEFRWAAMRGMSSFRYDVDYGDVDLYDLRRTMGRFNDPTFKSMWKMLAKTHDNEFMTRLRSHVIADRMPYYDGEEMARAYTVLQHNFFRTLVNRTSIDVARNFASEYMVAPYVGTTMPSTWDVDRLFEMTNFKPSRFIEYVLYESVRQGYGVIVDDGYSYRNERTTFFDEWCDVLRMQVQLKGKVYDKYPKDLSGMHRLLSFKCKLLEQVGDNEAFERRFDELSSHGRKSGTYLIRPPKSAEDIITEAQQQANCLASYVEPYKNGVTDLYFMRRLIEPDASLVTVEVRDGAIRQAYRASNNIPSEEEIEWLNEWAEENGFDGVPKSYHPMGA